MEEDDDRDFLPFSLTRSPSLVSLAPFSSYTTPQRRLSSHFSPPSRPVSAKRRLAWMSLQGRIVDAEEASSASAIKGGLSRDEAVAWQLFTPIQRFLIVAVIGVAVAESKKNRVISQLQKSVEFRDQVLLNMQQKLDNLCEQLYVTKDHPGTKGNAALSNGKAESEILSFGQDKINFVDCGCWLCDQHHEEFNGLLGRSVVKPSGVDEALQYKMNHANIEAEQEERRMSDLSDWASSVTSSAEIQMNNFAIEQDFLNLRKECDEKDATIKELTTFIRSSNANGSKQRILELEEIIRRKNMIITRLKKDMVVLEQKVVQLTRIQRPSSSASASKSWQLPAMLENVLYDMDSTSPSSSDADNSPPKNRPDAPVSPFQNDVTASTGIQKSAPAKISSSLVKPADKHSTSQSVSPLKERSVNQNFGSLSTLRQNQLSARGDLKKSRRQTQSASKNAVQPKRWV